MKALLKAFAWSRGLEPRSFRLASTTSFNMQCFFGGGGFEGLGDDCKTREIDVQFAICRPRCAVRSPFPPQRKAHRRHNGCSPPPPPPPPANQGVRLS